MDDKEDMKILLDIKETLGTVVGTITTIQEDIKELKERDLRQSDELDKAYEKAKARQDSIRDDLQHQINDLKDNFKNEKISIESAIKNLGTEIKELIIKSDNNNETQIRNLNTRVTNIENAKKENVYKWWQYAVDKLTYIVIAIIFAAVFKYFNFVPPKF